MSSESNSENETKEIEIEEEDKTPIREELSKMSFEELQQLKERLGSKVYNEAMFGPTRKRTRQTDFKRKNKNRPREMSSKIRVSTARSVVPSTRKVPRDPRFDSLCGEFNEKAFKNSYMFLSDVRAKEKEELKKELETETDATRKEKIKYLLQRMENQDREENNRKKKQEKEKADREAQIEALRQGQKPQYHNKTEKRVLDLVEQYEELKSAGKLQKHIEKQRKKNASKERRKMMNDTNE